MEKEHYVVDTRDPTKVELGSIIDVYQGDFFMGRLRIAMDQSGNVVTEKIGG